MNIASNPNEPTFVLLLGSYDSDTKNLLDAIKQKIAETYAGEGVYAILLDEVELYDTKECFVLVERWSKENVSVHIFLHDGELEESYELNVTEEAPIDEAVKDLLQKEYGITDVTKVTIFDKLGLLTKATRSILLVRDKEETRGGEIAELIYCIMMGYSSKVCMFKREGFDFSSMLMEFLDQLKVIIRTYRDRNGLIECVLRFLSYRMTEK